MRTPDYSALSELTAWRSEHGVVSVYLDIDRTERRQGWQATLRDALKRLVEEARVQGPRERWQALQTTSEAIVDRLLGDGAPPHGRCQIAFVEVSERRGREAFYQAQLSPRASVVVCEHDPYLLPLLELLGDGAPVGVVATSAGRIRLWEWRLGEAQLVDQWRFDPGTVPHERKGPMVRDPSRAQGTTSSGRDQFDQHIEARREHFLRSTGNELAASAGRRGWREVLCFGDETHWRRLKEAFGEKPRLFHVDEHNLVPADQDQIAHRVGQLRDRLNRSRKLSLIDQAQDGVYSERGRRGALGLADTVVALLEGRVEHLLLDAGRSYRETALDGGLVAELERARPGRLGLCERMIEQAIETRAEITPLDADVAERLADHDGVCAILRY